MYCCIGVNCSSSPRSCPATIHAETFQLFFFAGAVICATKFLCAFLFLPACFPPPPTRINVRNPWGEREGRGRVGDALTLTQAQCACQRGAPWLIYLFRLSLDFISFQPASMSNVLWGGGRGGRGCTSARGSQFDFRDWTPYPCPLTKICHRVSIFASLHFVDIFCFWFYFLDTELKNTCAPLYRYTLALVKQTFLGPGDVPLFGTYVFSFFFSGARLCGVLLRLAGCASIRYMCLQRTCTSVERGGYGSETDPAA